MSTKSKTVHAKAAKAAKPVAYTKEKLITKLRGLIKEWQHLRDTAFLLGAGTDPNNPIQAARLDGGARIAGICAADLEALLAEVRAK